VRRRGFLATVGMPLGQHDVGQRLDCPL
jgi:hypothetical protein